MFRELPQIGERCREVKFAVAISLDLSRCRMSRRKVPFAVAMSDSPSQSE